MARCIFENLTIDQARQLAEWFIEQGEQKCEEWFDIHEIKAPTVDAMHRGGCSRETPKGDIIVHCH